MEVYGTGPDDLKVPLGTLGQSTPSWSVLRTPYLVQWCPFITPQSTNRSNHPAIQLGQPGSF